MNIKLDNEFLALFIPEQTTFKKEDYIDELKTYIFKIMTYTLNDLAQENINLSDGNVTLNTKLKNYLEEKLDLILEVNETFIDTSNKLEIMLTLLEEIKGILITNSFDDEKILKIKMLYDKISQIKILMESNVFLLLEIPNILFKCIQNEDYKLFLEYCSFSENYFEEISKESSILSEDSINISTIQFTTKLKEKIEKINTFCSNFVLNKVKTVDDESIFKAEIFDVVKNNIDFNLLELQNFNPPSNDLSITVSKLLALLFFKIKYKYNKLLIKESTEEELQVSKNNLMDKFSKNFRFKTKNMEEFIYFSINLINCFFSNLNEIISNFQFDDSNELNRLKDFIISSVNFYFFNTFFSETLIKYFDVNENNKTKNEEKIKFSFNSSEHFFNESNHVIMMIKHKFLFMSNLLEKINNEPREIVNKNMDLLSFKINEIINQIFVEYILNIVRNVLKPDSLLKYIHYNRGDINKLLKIDENSKNEFINLIILNLGFVRDILSEISIKYSQSILTNIMICVEEYAKMSIEIINKYLVENSFYTKISKETISLLKSLNAFKKLIITEINEIYLNILKELGIDDRISKKFMNILEDSINYNI